jgi:hypothetical protein
MKGLGKDRSGEPGHEAGRGGALHAVLTLWF